MAMRVTVVDSCGWVDAEGKQHNNNNSYYYPIINFFIV